MLEKKLQATARRWPHDVLQNSHEEEEEEEKGGGGEEGSAGDAQNDLSLLQFVQLGRLSADGKDSYAARD